MPIASPFQKDSQSNTSGYSEFNCAPEPSTEQARSVRVGDRAFRASCLKELVIYEAAATLVLIQLYFINFLLKRLSICTTHAPQRGQCCNKRARSNIQLRDLTRNVAAVGRPPRPYPSSGSYSSSPVLFAILYKH